MTYRHFLAATTVAVGLLFTGNTIAHDTTKPNGFNRGGMGPGTMMDRDTMMYDGVSPMMPGGKPTQSFDAGNYTAVKALSDIVHLTVMKLFWFPNPLRAR